MSRTLNGRILYSEPANAREVWVAGLGKSYGQACRCLHNPLIAAGWLFYKATWGPNQDSSSGEPCLQVYLRKIKREDGGDDQRIEHPVRGVRLASSWRISTCSRRDVYL